MLLLTSMPTGKIPFALIHTFLSSLILILASGVFWTGVLKVCYLRCLLFFTTISNPLIPGLLMPAPTCVASLASTDNVCITFARVRLPVYTLCKRCRCRNISHHVHQERPRKHWWSRSTRCRLFWRRNLSLCHLHVSDLLGTDTLWHAFLYR